MTESWVYDVEELQEKHILQPWKKNIWCIYISEYELPEYEYIEGSDGLYLFTKQLGLVRILIDV